MMNGQGLCLRHLAWREWQRAGRVLLLLHHLWFSCLLFVWAEKKDAFVGCVIHQDKWVGLLTCGSVGSSHLYSQYLA